DDLLPKALHWVEHAATRADHAELWEVAARRYHEGLDLLGDQDCPQRRRFLTGRARARAGLRELDRARGDAAEAMQLARGADDPAAEVDLAHALLVMASV